MSPFAAVETRPAQFSIVQVDLPGKGVVNLGVLVQDSQSDALYLRVRRDLETLDPQAEAEDLEVLSALAEDLDQKAREMGAEALFEYLEGTLSTSIRMTDREPVLVEDFGRAVDRLYRKHVQSNVLKFRTHLPRYSLQAAAGKFLENQEVTELGWIETPPDLRLTPDMFVAQIAGHSMEPRIPDGSLCVFRYGVVGSRSGRLVLAEDIGSTGNDRYAVKRYKSEKKSDKQADDKPADDKPADDKPADDKQADDKPADEEVWRHKWVRLESLNPGYPSWDLDPDEDKYRIIAEFVRVLD